MITFRKRRIIGSAAAFVVSVMLLLIFHRLNDRLVNTSVASGLLLYLFMVALASYNARKRLSFLPIGTSATWLQFHIYAGYVCVLLFLIHVDFHAPHGGLESLLGTVFAIVAASGVVGLVISRTFPRRLSGRAGTVIFESIPEKRAALKAEADQLALDAVRLTGKATLADFYTFRLARFFMGPRNVLSHLLGSQRHLARTQTSVAGLRRYLSAQELEALDRLMAKVKEKDDLDFQYSLQLVLKLWLFVHIPLTFSLMIFGLFHGIYASLFI